MRRPARAASLVAVVGALLGLVPASPASAAPTQVWRRDLPGAPVYESSPLLVDLDASGTLDVVFGAHDARLHALKGTDGTNVAGWSQPTTDRINSSPSAADVDSDGRLEVFVGSGIDSSAAGALNAFGASGAIRFRRTLGDKVFRSPSVHSSPALADLNRDDRLDIAVGTLGLESAWAVDRNGNPFHNFPGPVGDDVYWDDTIFASPAIADVNGDGANDVIFGGDSSPGPPFDHRGGAVKAFSGVDGRQLWEVRTGDIVRSSPSVGDVDGDGRMEVVFGGGEFWGTPDATNVWVVDAVTGATQYKRQLDGVVNASPTLVDLNGDGRLDIAVGTFNSRFGQGAGGSVYALNGVNGTDMTGFPKASGGGTVLGQIVTADLDGDGGQDLLVPTGAFIAAFDGSTGSTMFRLAEGAGVSFQNSPAVADVDADGRLDVLAAGIRPSDGSGSVFRWALDPQAVLGARGWHQFRKDIRRTGSFTQNVPVADTIPFSRIAGADRYATAVSLSSGASPGGTVIVATGTSFADALAGGPAAAALDGPVLLVSRDAVPSSTAARLRALSPERILVLGGEAAVSASTFAALGEYADEVERIAGPDRFTTAANISAEAFSPLVPVVYIATGRSFADALAGAAAGARQGGPVLLVEPGSLPGPTAAELRRLLPPSIVILGGTGAVSAAVESELRTYSPSVTRVAGADRYDTAVRLSRAAFPGGADVVYIATGATFPDALAGGPVVGAAGAPFLLVPGRCVPLTVRTELDRLGADRVVLLGGEGAVSSSIGALSPC